MVKAGIAAIPAGIIVAVFWGFFASLLPRFYKLAEATIRNFKSSILGNGNSN